MISSFQKKIYNDHLVTSRISKGEPFRIRKNFDKMDEDKVNALDKLERMFTSYDTINIELFFKAPYETFEDEDYFPLEFYTTQRAKKAYALYMKRMETEDPDSEDSMKRLIKSLKFIKNFCEEKELTLDKYPLYIEHKIPFMVEHLKNHDINMYTLHSLGVSKLKVENRILDFMFSDFWITFQKTKNKFFLSKKMKKLAKKATHKIQTQLKNKI